MDPPRIQSFVMPPSGLVDHYNTVDYNTKVPTSQANDANAGHLTHAAPCFAGDLRMSSPPMPLPSHPSPMKLFTADPGSFSRRPIEEMLGPHSQNQSQTEEHLTVPNYINALDGARLTGMKDPRAASPDFYDISKPTCSLNLLCFRSEADGCHRQEIRCALRSRYPDNENFQDTIKANPSFIYTDDQFFSQMKRAFETKLQGRLRCWLSLKTLKGFRVLAVSEALTVAKEDIY